MKILCVSDHVDPLVYSTRIKERFHDVELVLSAGDLPMEYLGYIASSINKELLFVFGNHNLRNLHQFRRRPAAYDVENPLPRPLTENNFGSTYIGGRIIKTRQGLLIAGLGGSMLYNGDENQFTDFQMFWKVIRLVPRMLWNKLIHGRYLDILLTHAPPRGIHDKPDRPHRGFQTFLWMMKVFKPRYLLHGHVHLYDLNTRRETTFHSTEIINVYDHYVLEYPEGAGNAGIAPRPSEVGATRSRDEEDLA